tara:strand:- start:81807 stop:83816 length:2010 start_codon:yes stop_codon:yes gene_type:complete
MDFLNSSIFYYFFFLAIPVIIHLFNFRKQKTIYFSSTFFLREIATKNKNKFEIKRWLILISRMIAMTCIILAFALPYIKNKNDSKDFKVGLYIDNSFSMQRSDSNNKDLISYAKENAVSILHELHDSETVLILTNDFEKKHQKWYSPKEAVELINAIPISSNQTNLTTIISRYNQAIDTLDDNTFYVFSDFQTKRNKQKKIQNKYSKIKIGLLDIDNSVNISIDSCYFSTPIRRKNEIENLNVVFTNHSTVDKTVKSKLMINSKQKGSYNIEIPANKTIHHIVSYINPMEKDTIKGIIEINDDNIVFDNKLYFSYSTNQKIDISTISNNDISTGLFNIFSDSIFRLAEYNIDHIEYEELKNAQLIVLDELNEIPSGLIKNLESFLSNGGNLVVFLNEHINRNDYNQLFTYISIDSISTWKEGEHQIKYINYENKIFEDVFSEKRSNIHLPKINGYHAIKKNKQARSRKVLNFLNNEPFLSEYLYKDGRVFICYSGLKSERQNFSQHALFVPFIYNASLINLKTEKLYYYINQETIIEKNDITNNDIIYLKQKEQFEMIPSIIDLNQKTLINFQNKIPHAGNFDFLKNNKIKQPISFNYNRDESIMEFLNKSQIKDIFETQKIDFLTTENNTISKKDTGIKKQKRLEDFFIILAIILLIIELILLRIWKM